MTTTTIDLATADAGTLYLRNGTCYYVGSDFRSYPAMGATVWRGDDRGFIVDIIARRGVVVVSWFGAETETTEFVDDLRVDV